MNDERFHTPRALASSSRSIGSFVTTVTTARSVGSQSESDSISCRDRWHTPRASAASSRSICSFTSARSSFNSPIEPFIQIHDDIRFSRESHGTIKSNSRDCACDFRRFSGDPSSSNFRREIQTRKITSHQKHYDLTEDVGTMKLNNDANDIRVLYPVQEIFSLARHGKVREVEEILIQGFPIEAKDENGNTILAIGSQNGSKRIVKLALCYGANIDATNKHGNSALHFAFKYGFGKTLGEYLISKGANTRLRNNEGKTYSEM